VQFVGQPIAFIVAENLRAASDANDLIMADFKELPVVVDGEAALDAGAPQLHDEVPSNRAYDWAIGDEEATDAAFASAEHVSRVRMENTRIMVLYSGLSHDARANCECAGCRATAVARAGARCRRRVWHEAHAAPRIRSDLCRRA